MRGRGKTISKMAMESFRRQMVIFIEGRLKTANHMAKVNLLRLSQLALKEEYGPIGRNILDTLKVVISTAKAVIYGKIRTHMTETGNMDKCAAKANKPFQMVANAVELSKVEQSMERERSAMETEGCMKERCLTTSRTARAISQTRMGRDIQGSGSLGSW